MNDSLRNDENSLDRTRRN